MRVWPDVYFPLFLALLQFGPSSPHAASPVVPTQAPAWLPGKPDANVLNQLKTNIFFLCVTIIWVSELRNGTGIVILNSSIKPGSCCAKHITGLQGLGVHYQSNLKVFFSSTQATPRET